ncbi:Serine hydrolase FSH [Penicillium riverlandense]|uniref:Serine hydrolase FSH n=1 Tax=Penicillium riverlandense TaxID=1903569 RepID=UPI002546A6D5|nr:Serine hydrolase FSH [Penicillium riverlandense]KAJ5815535.1 Serine hydrolase FSH [Penicillium riverlandense]
MQTARIREELDEHEFVFIDGAVATTPSEGAAVVTNEFYGYIPNTTNDVGQYSDLVVGLVEYVRSQGPFDGVMGFSEGGMMAALLLIEDARNSFAGFKCGIFFSAAVPFDPDVVRTRHLRCIDPTIDGVVVHVPTAVIVEKNFARLRHLSPLDKLWPDDEEALVSICAEASREVVRHDLGHHVPGSASTTEGLTATLQAIERTIERASELYS